MSKRQDDSPDLIAPSEFRPSDPTLAASNPLISRRTLLMLAGTLALLLTAVFVFTAVPIQLRVSPEPESVGISGALSLPVGERRLVRPGELRVQARREGYHPLDTPIQVTRGGDRQFEFELQPLPGRVNIESAVDGARVIIDDADVGQTPLTALELEPGEYEIRILAERYLPWNDTITVEGRGQQQTLQADLAPAWASISLSSDPEGAEVSLEDGTVLGTTPGTFELLQGVHTLVVKLEGHKAWQEQLEVVAQQDETLDPIQLEPADGLLMVSSRPSGATLTVNGQFLGRTPVEIELEPATTHQLDVFHPGYQRVRREVRLQSGVEQRITVDLPAETGELKVDVQPADAELLVDGQLQGSARQTLQLPAVTHEIEIRKSGYVPYRTSVTPRPGHPQEISLRLQTVEEARRAALRPVTEHAAGGEMQLLQPAPFTMGASRREPGRRANEVLREVRLTREFYLGRTEVTNAQFRKFRPEHDSGEWEGESLNRDNQPVVNVSWHDAALFANWLSEQEDLPRAYVVRNGRVVGFDPEATGYRLPTEAEWEWAARVKPDGTQLRFPWGDAMPPPERFGNYADRTVSHLLGRTIIGYTDGQMVSAPVANYQPNERGIFDLGSNVAEWVNDFYAATSEDLPANAVDPLGPDGGEYHVIRGASWMHGTLTELRLTFRDYGRDGRRDLGFRVARFVE